MSEPSTPSGPDVVQLGRETLPETAFPGGRKQTFRVFLEPAVHADIWKHATETISVEICGVLVGKIMQDADGPFVLVSGSIRGDAAANKFAEVTFTHETWAKINKEMDSSFANYSIVGWYHSHPDFGIFLSDRDRFIQENFFSGPGQTAYVVDPVRKTEGVFCWRAGKPTLLPHYWVGNRVQVATAAGEEAPPTRPDMPGSSSAHAAHSSSAAGEKFSWLSVFSQVSICMAFLLLGFMMKSELSDIERLHIQQGVLARASQYLVLHEGLKSQTDQLESDLVALRKKSSFLAKDHLKLSENDKDTAELWNDVLTRLDKTRGNLRMLKATYCLSQQEEDYLESLRRRKPKSPDSEDARGTNDPDKEAKPAEKDKEAKPAEKDNEAKPPETKEKAAKPAEKDSSEKPVEKTGDKQEVEPGTPNEKKD